jgi:hypothetical protein
MRGLGSPWNRAVLLALVLSCLGWSVVAVSAAGVEPELTLPPGPGPVEVRASYRLEDVTDIDDRDETFSFTGTLVLEWRDERQAFDAGEAGVKEKVYQGRYQFEEVAPAWFPQMALVNQHGGCETVATTMVVQPDGRCRLTTVLAATAETDFRMRRYPFDRHSLEALFMLPGFGVDGVRLVAGGAEVREGMQVSQWRHAGVKVAVRRTASAVVGEVEQLVVSVEVVRDSIFSLRLVVLPLALIVVLSWSVFWMERSSLGDRINVSFVGILTAVAYQNVVSDLLPHVSEVTLMHGFLNVCTVVMAATVVVNLWVGVCDKRGHSGLGDRIDRRCRRLFPLAFAGLVGIITAIAFLVY